MPRSVSFIYQYNRKLNHNMVASKNLKDRKELEKQGFFGAKSKILKHFIGKKYYKNLIGFEVSVEILIKQVKFAFSNVFQFLWLFAYSTDTGFV